ncbi:MAG: TIGR00730 family Rossman fold protein [Pseudobdellovibrionaceae bacterium]
MAVKRKKICVYCGSRLGVHAKYQELAISLGQALVKRNWDLVYGGGRVGLMGVISQTVMQNGGDVIGVIPGGLFGKEVADTQITDLRVVASMHERKALMEQLSDGFIALPGGWGTLDEYFEILTWAQIGIHRKPIGILNFEGFFDPLLQQTEVMIREGFIDPKNLDLLTVDPTVEGLLRKLESRL